MPKQKMPHVISTKGETQQRIKCPYCQLMYYVRNESLWAKACGKQSPFRFDEVCPSCLEKVGEWIATQDPKQHKPIKFTYVPVNRKEKWNVTIQMSKKGT